MYLKGGESTEDDITCVCCGKEILSSQALERHHFPVPLFKGGTATVDLCLDCHRAVHQVPLDSPELVDHFFKLMSSSDRYTNILIMKLFYLASNGKQP